MSSQSRASRRVLTAAAAAATAALVAGPVAAAATTAEPTQLGVGPDGSVTFTFVGRIEQDGPIIVNVGYLTSVEGMDTADLFTDDDPLNRSAETARFTYFTSGLLEERSVVENLFTTSGSATTTFHHQPDGGADLDDPSSFDDGDEIAEMTSVWDNLINVQAPNTGILTAQSDELQSSATPFTTDDGSYVLGTDGNRFRLVFSGHGVRTDPDAPRATVNYSGQAIEVADAIAGSAPGDAATDDGGTADSPLALVLAIVALAAAGVAIVLGLRGRPEA